MSDKELSDYIKTIDPKFNSNLEKGTIEMTNEYYNLLEEYIARLNYKKDLYKSVLDKIKEEAEIIEEPQEHKIPEKLTIGVNEYDEIHINNEIYGERQVRVVADKVNEILDYLEANND